jgi:serine protease AprX
MVLGTMQARKMRHSQTGLSLRVGRMLAAARVAVALTFAALAAAAAWSPATRPAPDRTQVIVQARDMAAAAEAVRQVGGRVTHELGIIDAVGAALTPTQTDAIRRAASARVYVDRTLRTAGSPQSWAPSLVSADRLHAGGITGVGVTIAVLDTGAWPNSPIKADTSGKVRLLQGYDAISNALGTSGTNDTSGHGTHVTSVAASSDLGPSGVRNGIAPNVNLVIVRAFNLDGRGTYADVIRGINWIVANKATYNIRVLNCSFTPGTGRTHSTRPS